MTTTVRPIHVCPACGGVNEDAAARIARLVEQRDLLSEDIANLERELRGKRAQIKRLKADQDAARRRDPMFAVAQRVLTHWQRVCAPAAREPACGKRLENCLARLHGDYTEADLKRACDGYALKPYVVGGKRSHEGPKDSWHADAELIFRSARHVDNGIRIADRADDLREVMAPVSPNPAAPTLSPLGEAALRMARHGFYVFPVEQGGKRPVTRHGLKDAKRDEAAIRACWTRTPHLNVAVRTGRESGIVVLDVDGDEGWDSLHRLEDDHGELPTTLSVTTPGGGQHFYFTHPGSEVKNSVGLVGPYLDIRGDNGYVVAPPSIGPGGRAYAVDEAAPIVAMPAWLLDRIASQQTALEDALRAGEWAKLLNGGAKAGARNNRLTSIAGKLYGTFGLDGTLTMVDSLNRTHCEPPLPLTEVRKIVESVERMRRAA